MEARGNTPRIWTELSDLVEILTKPGPFVTAHLPTPGDQENASQHNQGEWESVRERLAQQGATEDTLLNIDDLVADAHENARSLYVISGDKEVYHASYWNTELLAPFARYEALPVFAPLIDLRQGACNYITVVADRTGADITAVTLDKNPQTRHSGGSDAPVHKAQAGGWSHLRYHHRVENTWEKNAKDAVEHLVKMAAEEKPRIIFLVGDVRAVQQIQEELPVSLAVPVEVVDGSRANDSGEYISQDDIQRVLARIEMEDTLAIKNKLAEEFGQHDRAAVGIPGVVRALQMGQVEVLIVEGGAAGEHLVWIGPEGNHIAERRDDLVQLGVTDPIQVPLREAAIRCALMTSATVRVVPEMERANQHVAAILRWS